MWSKKKKPGALWTRAFPAQVPDAAAAARLEKKLYRIEAREYVSRCVAAGQRCIVVESIPSLKDGRKYGHPISARLTEIHHRNGRQGSLLRDKRFWIPVSRLGHRFIHSNIAEARIRGWICAAGLWNQPQP